jgi:hypothetical protein
VPVSVISSDLYQEIIERPYTDGNRELRVVSGYSSPSFLFKVMNHLKELKLKLIVGMAAQEPLDIGKHLQYQYIAREFSERLTIEYYYGNPPTHSKVYYWPETADAPGAAFVGSGNLTSNGLVRFNETFARVNPQEVTGHFNLNPVVDCLAEGMEKVIDFQYSSKDNVIDTSEIKLSLKSKSHVNLMLTKAGNPEEIHSKSGLNWGQRERREKNQAYIPVPHRIHMDNPDFFPPREEIFNIITDDGESIICVMAQDNSKAIESHYDNSIIGKYFRRRLNLNAGEFITVADLNHYGRKSVTIYKMDEETYYMDFSPETAF